MPLTYLDQNAVIYLLEKTETDPAFRAKLDAAIASGRLNVVVSSWNLIETAKTQDVNMAAEKTGYVRAKLLLFDEFLKTILRLGGDGNEKRLSEHRRPLRFISPTLESCTPGLGQHSSS